MSGLWEPLSGPYAHLIGTNKSLRGPYDFISGPYMANANTLVAQNEPTRSSYECLKAMNGHLDCLVAQVNPFLAMIILWAIHFSPLVPP